MQQPTIATVNLLDTQTEPSEAQLEMLMDSVRASAMQKREKANQRLQETLQEQLAQAKQNVNAARLQGL